MGNNELFIYSTKLEVWRLLTTETNMCIFGDSYESPGEYDNWGAVDSSIRIWEVVYMFKQL